MNHGGPFKRVFLIRHGDTVDENGKKIYKGWLDIPLSKEGRERIKVTSCILSRYSIDAVYASDLSRAVESANIIASCYGLSVNIIKGLREINLGKWEGLSFDEQYHDGFKRWLEDPLSYTPPNGEPLYEASERVLMALKDIINEKIQNSIAIVTHAGVIRIIIAEILGIKPSYMYRIAQDYGCINIIDIYDNLYPVLKLINYRPGSINCI